MATKLEDKKPGSGSYDTPGHHYSDPLDQISKAEEEAMEARAKEGAEQDLKEKEAGGGATNLEKPTKEKKGPSLDSFSGDDKPSRLKNLSAKISRNKGKAAAGGGVTGLIIGMAIFMLSAPGLELVRFAQILQKFHFSAFENVSDDRTSKLMRYIRHSKAGHPERTRLGIIGNRLADKVQADMKRNGIEPEYTDVSGRGRYLNIDRGNDRFEGKNRDEIRRVLIDSGMSERSVDKSLSDSPPYRLDLNKLSSREFRNVTKATLHDAGYGKITSSIGARVMGARAGINWHPLERKLREKSNSLEERYKRWKEQRQQDTNGGTSSNATGGDDGDDGDEDNAKSGDPQQVDQQKRTLKVGKLASKFASAAAKSATVVGAIVGGTELMCMMEDFANTLDGEKYDRVIKPAMRMGMTAVALGDQMRSGYDINYDDVRFFMGQMHGYDDTGNFSNYTDAASVQAELGQEVVGTDANESLKSIGDKSFLESVFGRFAGGPLQTLMRNNPQLLAIKKGGGLLGDVLGGIGSVVGGIPLVGDVLVDPIKGLIGNVKDVANYAVKKIDDGICKAFDGVNWVTEYATDLALDATDSALGTVGAGGAIDSARANINKASDKMMGWIYSAILGEGVNPLAAGADYGNITNYGVRLAANEQALSSGGTELSHNQIVAHKAESEEWDRQEFNTHSLAYRLFNKSDSRSTVSKVLEKTGPNLSQNVASLAHSLVTIPSSLFSNMASVFSPKKAAAEADPELYDYGFAKYGFGLDELDTAVGNRDPYDNADRAASILEGNDGSKYIERALKCFGVTLGQEIPREGGDMVWYSRGTGAGVTEPYANDEYPRNECEDDSQAWLTIRFFIVDSALLEALACYKSSAADDESCIHSGMVAGPQCGGTAGVTGGGANGAPPEDYSRGTFNDFSFSKRTVFMLEDAQKRAGVNFRVTRGGYDPNLAHERGNGIDIGLGLEGYSRAEVEKIVRALREAGFAAWARGTAWGDSYGPHIHAVTIGDKDPGGTSAYADGQVKSYFAGKNGFGAGGLGTGPDVHLKSVGRPIPDWAKQFGEGAAGGSAADAVECQTTGDGSAGDWNFPLGKEIYDKHTSAHLQPHRPDGGFTGDGSHSNDISFGDADTGLPVYAMLGGKVVKQPLPRSGRQCAGNPNGDNNGGMQIESQVGKYKVVITYAHGDNQKFKVGDTVPSGAHIMNLGNVGNSCGSHLHLDGEIDGKSFCTQTVMRDLAEGKQSDVSTLVSRATPRCGA